MLSSYSYMFYLVMVISYVLYRLSYLGVLVKNHYCYPWRCILSVILFGGFYFVQQNIMSIGMTLGCILNGFVVAMNRGKMPVCPIAMRKAKFSQCFIDNIDNLENYTVMDENTKLKILVDRYPFLEQVHSIGDIVLYIGSFIFLVHKIFY